MEVNDPLITMATGNIGSPGSQRYTKAMKLKAERMQELTARQGEIEEKLRSKIEELKMLCLQEAELTGRLPSDFPLEPGEMPPTVNQRVTITSKGLNPSTRPGQ
ncbi:coiled-coil domain-containing protein 120-like, partial [Cetorhinus maximus]